MSFRLFRSQKKKKTMKRGVPAGRTLLKASAASLKRSQKMLARKKSELRNTCKKESENCEETVQPEKVDCSVCQHTIYKQNYKRHMLKHKNPNGFKCDVCPRKYKHSRNLSKHKFYAHGDAPVTKCEHCDFTTVHSSYLQVSCNNITMQFLNYLYISFCTSLHLLELFKLFIDYQHWFIQFDIIHIVFSNRFDTLHKLHEVYS